MLWWLSSIRIPKSNGSQAIKRWLRSVRIFTIVTSLKCDYDLSTCSYRKDHVPFAHFENTFIAPGQSFITNIDRLKFFENPSELHFFIKYTANGVTYSDQFTINPKVDVDLIQTRASTAGKELHNISYTLQDFVEKLL